MPYVEGFGTWPFGEEWLWEALAGSYLPLLEVLDAGAPLTLSLTPVLCDQLEVPGLDERFYAFVGAGPAPHPRRGRRGAARGGPQRPRRRARPLLGRLRARTRASCAAVADELLAALAPHAAWTSAATHAILPLLATEAGVREQVRSGVRSHRRRFGEGWQGRLLAARVRLSSRALDPILLEAGVRAVCVEATARHGLGAPQHLRPMRTAAGLVLVPVDRETMSLVWSDRGLPRGGLLPRLPPPHRPSPQPLGQRRACLRPRGGARARGRACGGLRHPYDRPSAPRAGRRARRRPRRVRARHGAARALVVRGHRLAARGHRGVRAPGPRAACASTTRSSASSPSRRRAGPSRPASSWGAGGDLSTWSGPQVASQAFAARAAELDVLHAGAAAGPAAIRELMALQASDWPFMITRGSPCRTRTSASRATRPR